MWRRNFVTCHCWGWGHCYSHIEVFLYILPLWRCGVFSSAHLCSAHKSLMCVHLCMHARHVSARVTAVASHTHLVHPIVHLHQQVKINKIIRMWKASNASVTLLTNVLGSDSDPAFWLCWIYSHLYSFLGNKGHVCKTFLSCKPHLIHCT